MPRKTFDMYRYQLQYPHLVLGTKVELCGHFAHKQVECESMSVTTDVVQNKLVSVTLGILRSCNQSMRHLANTDSRKSASMLQNVGKLQESPDFNLNLHSIIEYAILIEPESSLSADSAHSKMIGELKALSTFILKLGINAGESDEHDCILDQLVAETQKHGLGYNKA